MFKYRVLKAEFLKESSDKNLRITMIMPLIFVIFCLLSVSLMGQSPSGKSHLVAAAFNWLPTMLLPVTLSLLVANHLARESEAHTILYIQLGVHPRDLLISQFVVVAMESAAILMMTTVGIIVTNYCLIGDTINWMHLIVATGCLWLGMLPIVSMAFLIMTLTNRTVTLVFNFVFGLIGAIFTTTRYWPIFPGGYSFRMMSVILGIHPNGTYLKAGDGLLRVSHLYTALAFSLIAAIVFMVAVIRVKVRAKADA